MIILDCNSVRNEELEFSTGLKFCFPLLYLARFFRGN